MNDFDYDCYLKRKTANGAKHRRASKIGPRGCKLRSDNMTKKELEKMNGETVTYTMNKRVSWDTFKSWPNEIKSRYLAHLRMEFNVSNKQIWEMFGISGATFSRALSELNLRFGRQKVSKFDQGKWNKFLNPDSEIVEEQKPVEPVELNFDVSSVLEAEKKLNNEFITNGLESVEAPIPETESPSLPGVINMNFTIVSDRWDQLGEILSLIDISSGARITVNIEEFREAFEK